MQDLLPHYEQELAFLRTHADEFARRNPKIAGRLLPGTDAGADPHVERLVESFALLAARVHKRLDDDFPLVTESLLEVLYPHYLRPFPSCSIACFEPGAVAAAVVPPTTAPPRIGRGTTLVSRPVRGVACRFRTAFDVDLPPVRLDRAAFRAGPPADAPAGWPREATAVLTLELALTSPLASWAGLGVDRLRFFLDGDASQVAALREALCGRTLAVRLQGDRTRPSTAEAARLPQGLGFGDDEALLDLDPRSHPAYRLLTEYFAFPGKFDFVEVPLPRAIAAAASRVVVLELAIAGLEADPDAVRLLETIGERHLRLGCTPVVNLSRRMADPIRVTHASASHPVLPDGRRAFGHEVWSIDRVWRVRQTPDGETVDEFRPFFSLRHDELLGGGRDAGAGGRYWSAHRDETMAERSPGHELSIQIVDVDGDPTLPHTETLSVEVTTTNRDLPAALSIGQPGGDLFLEGVASPGEVRLVRRPTPTVRFERGRGALWRLVSHLSLNHLSLSAGGIDALREWLRLYDLPRSANNARQVAGLVAIEHRPASACLPGNPFPTFVRGTEIRLTVDERNFVGSGWRLLAEVLDRFFGLYAQINSYTRLTLVSARSGEVLVACPRRAGDVPLL